MNKLWSFVLAVSVCVGLTAVTYGSSVGSAVADAAADYYADITAVAGDKLLGQVHDLITTTHRKYTTYEDCKTPSKILQTDKGSTDDMVMDFYSQADIASTWGYGANGTWNREHVWCQSLSNKLWGTDGGGSDLHHLRPTETKLNATRGNLKYGVASSKNPVYYTDAKGNNVALGGYTGGNTFEPLDQVKGDVARIVLYVYTHYNTYNNVSGTTNGSGSSGYFGTLSFTNIMSASNEDAAIKLLLAWNESDPVDAIETARNEAVYRIQGNRNPFIDHPEYAEAIWGDPQTSGPEKPVPPEPDDETTGGNVTAFCNAVSDISDATLDGWLSSIGKAVSEYKKLSEEDKRTAADAVAALKKAIADYNAVIASYNSAANVSEGIALGGIGG